MFEDACRLQCVHADAREAAAWLDEPRPHRPCSWPVGKTQGTPDPGIQEIQEWPRPNTIRTQLA
jgi:hypothetical protein